MFAPILSSSFDVCSFAGEALSPPSLQQQAAAVTIPHLTVTVVVVELGRSLYFLFSNRLLTCKRSF